MKNFHALFVFFLFINFTAARTEASTTQVNFDFVINSATTYSDSTLVSSTPQNITGVASLIYNSSLSSSNEAYIPATLALKFNQPQTSFSNFINYDNAKIKFETTNSLAGQPAKTLMIEWSESGFEFTGNFVETYNWGSATTLTYHNLPAATQLIDLDNTFWTSLLNNVDFSFTLSNYSYTEGIYMSQYYSFGSSNYWNGSAKAASVIETPLPPAFWLFGSGLLYLLKLNEQKKYT